MLGEDSLRRTAGFPGQRFVASGVFSLLALSLSSAAAAERCKDLAGHLVSVEGTVRVAGEILRMGEEICAGESVEVGRSSRISIRLADTQSVVRINQGSVFIIRPSNRKRSWLELLRGTIYLFSRQPKSFRLETPYMNAGIEGTEFVMEANTSRSGITVIEGRVRASNTADELLLGPGETASSTSRDGPMRRSAVDPENAVRWALHYPPIGAAERASGNAREAATLLATGDVEAAIRLLERAPVDAVSFALRSMIAVTQNRAAEAMRLAERAVTSDSESSAAYTALSYAHQARFDIEAALASARRAVANDPRNAHGLARQAELELGVDDTGAAIVSAREAVQVDPNNSRAHTVLGFVHLIRLEVAAAEDAFTDAVVRDPGDPLPRLGLGLATIREGRLVEGREHIEVAASLDPNDALVRSYLGKAYFEERQMTDAADQLALARSFDPEDPTPWFYQALLDQALNRPVDAFNNIEQARARNDNQLVYQSRLLVDKSDAAGSLSLARIYTDLGFEQPAINESTRSIELDPSNFSAYRFLADSYAQGQVLEAARRSVLFQAALLQPLTINPVQPYTQDSDLLILPGTDPSDPGIREYSPLFEQEGLQLAGSLVGGTDATLGDNLVFSGLTNRIAYSLGQFHYETDGFRTNADIDHDVYYGSMQGQLTSKVFVQAGIQSRESEQGDLTQSFDSNAFLPGFRKKNDSISPHIGMRVDFQPRTKLLFAARQVNVSEMQMFPSFGVFVEAERKGQQMLTRLIHSRADVKHNLGVDTYDLDSCLIQGTDSNLDDPCASPSGESKSSFTHYYYRTDFAVNRHLTGTLGLAYSSIDDDSVQVDEDLIGPRFGLRWRPTPAHELRLAFSRGIKRELVADESLEPMVVAGFNQNYDDSNGARYVNAGIAYDAAIDFTRFGVQLVHRELDVPIGSSDGTRKEPRTEFSLRSYWNRILRSDVSLGIDPLYERFEREISSDQLNTAFPQQIELLLLPLNIRYTHRNGFFLQGQFGIVYQKVENLVAVQDENEIFSSVTEDSELFTSLDISLGLRLPTRRATFRLDVRNLLDESYLYQGVRFGPNEPVVPRFAPNRTIVGRVSFLFR